MVRQSGLDTALVLISAAASWGVRWNTYVFLRLVSHLRAAIQSLLELTRQLPFASRFMPRTWTCLAIYIATSALILKVGSRPKSVPAPGGSHRRRWSPRAVQLVAGSTQHDDLLTSYLNLGVNFLCAAMCLDFIYRSHYLLPSTDVVFARMGYVSHDTASIAIRSRTAETEVRYWARDGVIRTATASATTTGDTDQTGYVRLMGLDSGTKYHYNTSTSLEGTFTTHKAPKDMSSFSLLSTSCQKPNWPYSPSSHPLRIQGMEHLDQYLASSHTTPEMMLFLGDFICV